jgi:hypothetical protein
MNSKSKALAICILIFSLLVSGCGQGQAFDPMITPMSMFTLIPTLISTPTLTSTPTPAPGPELLIYNLKVSDLPQCRWVEYSISLESSWL